MVPLQIVQHGATENVVTCRDVIIVNVEPSQRLQMVRTEDGAAGGSRRGAQAPICPHIQMRVALYRYSFSPDRASSPAQSNGASQGCFFMFATPSAPLPSLPAQSLTVSASMQAFPSALIHGG